MAKSLFERFRAAMEVLERRAGSQGKAAKACGVSPQSWGQWKSRGIVPRASTMERVIAVVKR